MQTDLLVDQTDSLIGRTDFFKEEKESGDSQALLSSFGKENPDSSPLVWLGVESDDSFVSPDDSQY